MKVFTCLIVLLLYVIFILDDPPNEVINLSIPMIKPTSFMAQWSEPSSDPVCGTVQYIVTVYTEGIVISNETINTTAFNATGLCVNTSYEINVTAINNAGSIDPVTMQMMTNETGMYVNIWSLCCYCNCMSNKHMYKHTGKHQACLLMLA